MICVQNYGDISNWATFVFFDGAKMGQNGANNTPLSASIKNDKMAEYGLNTELLLCFADMCRVFYINPKNVTNIL